ncbi:hypothetical protein GSI_12710 [Ganoderma sinense ZZ0214-1]|uniref:Uncharacterized protein n=1 Tax=Ganoderma sinense ZZ0214-1 TaxID=1077348 RepID=A0A2G8RTL6_9APHY|nr:hypothetical protein GSI_12710 [Ganoderma sinense ZZ0214-1]
MSRSDNSDVWFPPSLPELPTFSAPPPLTISGEDLARMVPPMPTVDLDLPAELITSDEVEEADTQSPCKRSFPRTQNSLANTNVVAQKPSRKSDSTRGRLREQKKRAAASRAKKAAVIPRKESTKKTG